jgi:hypothetical protein
MKRDEQQRACLSVALLEPAHLQQLICQIRPIRLGEYGNSCATASLARNGTNGLVEISGRLVHREVRRDVAKVCGDVLAAEKASELNTRASRNTHTHTSKASICSPTLLEASVGGIKVREWWRLRTAEIRRAPSPAVIRNEDRPRPRP